MRPGDFAVVEDTTHVPHPLVAASCLWHHTWEFAGIPLPGVGRPRYVVVDPCVPTCGLIRAIMALLHARRRQGRSLWVITGSFYRQVPVMNTRSGLDGARSQFGTDSRRESRQKSHHM
jgi:hypothetical protein